MGSLQNGDGWKATTSSVEHAQFSVKKDNFWRFHGAEDPGIIWASEDLKEWEEINEIILNFL